MKANRLAFYFLLGISLACSGQQSKKIDTETGRATPAPKLRVYYADSEEEKEALGESFSGITSDGKVRPGLYPIEVTGLSTVFIKNAVENFLLSLNDAQKESCVFPVDDKEWRRWSNIDIGLYKRTGIGLANLTEEQKNLSFQILHESLSPKGFEKTQNIMKMEDYLARLSGEFENLGHDKYWFTFFGKPSDTEPWGWQIDGHHLVINYFVLGDQVVMTPTFMGSEPNYIEDGENAGTRTFEKEELLGLTLYHSLNDEQKQQATLFDRKDVSYNQTESFRDNAIIPYAGIEVSSFSESQLMLLTGLISEYVGNMREGYSKIKMDEVLAHIDETYFSWVGAMDGSGPFYYRIQSPVIIIEFDHQKPVFLEGDKPSRKHVHTVVRTPNGNDYGKDLLRQHLEQNAH